VHCNTSDLGECHRVVREAHECDDTAFDRDSHSYPASDKSALIISSCPIVPDRRLQVHFFFKFILPGTIFAIGWSCYGSSIENYRRIHTLAPMGLKAMMNILAIFIVLVSVDRVAAPSVSDTSLRCLLVHNSLQDSLVVSCWSVKDRQTRLCPNQPNWPDDPYLKSTTQALLLMRCTRWWRFGALFD